MEKSDISQTTIDQSLKGRLSDDFQEMLEFFIQWQLSGGTMQYPNVGNGPVAAPAPCQTVSYYHRKLCIAQTC
ncbi:MAG: hypothetical protein ACSHXK_17055, partial [Oceanococcus sp.]